MPPMIEFHCQSCKVIFEQITTSSDTGADPDRGKCPTCGTERCERSVSRFAVGGRGDLRESTLHGCHGDFTGVDGHHHHGHDHDS